MSIRSATNVALYFDPDTGLEPNGGGDAKHVLESEAFAFWNALPQGSVFVFYQHETNKAGKPWIEDKRAQLADAIRIPIQKLGVASSPRSPRTLFSFMRPKPNLSVNGAACKLRLQLLSTLRSDGRLP